MSNEEIFLHKINVSNKRNNYIGGFTIEEERIISEFCIDNTLNLFSGNSEIGHWKIDYSSKKADFNCDVFEFLELWEPLKCNTVIIDPPYNQKYADKYQKIGNTPKQFIIFADVKNTNRLFKLISDINPKRIIIKSWNYYVPIGYYDKGSFLCYAGGYRKPTILMLLEKL